MDETKLNATISEQLLHPRGPEGVMDALTDPACDVLKEIVDEMAELAKAELLRRRGLPNEEKKFEPLRKTGIFAQAKTAEELGLTDADIEKLGPDDFTHYR